jgi:hypothetical protein
MNPDLLRNFLTKHPLGRRDTTRMAGAAGAVGVAAMAGIGLTRRP